MKEIVRLLLLVLSLATVPAYAQSTEAWVPTTVDWNCAAEGLGKVCAVTAVGPLPASLSSGVDAYFVYYIRKGQTAGTGPLLSRALAKLTCSRGASSMTCSSPRQVLLGAGISVAPDTAAVSVTLNIFPANGAVGSLFDWDGDGDITPQKEGLMLLRYAIGFRDSALSSGVALQGGKSTQSVQADIENAEQYAWFDFSARNAPNVILSDALVFERCVQGLRGSALARGTSIAASAALDSKCAALLAKY